MTTTINNEDRIEAVKSFIEASNKHFEAWGIYLESVRIKRNEDGSLASIEISYEDRKNPE